MMFRRTTTLAVMLIAPLAWAQPAPPALPTTSVATPAPAAPAAPAAAATPPAPPSVADLLETHIEQVRRGNRVTEVRVTGADGERRYSMENRESRPPSSVYGTGSGLSAPNFLNIEF
jgi:hypothetical protein